MSPFLYIWFAAIAFSLATGRWIVVASLCWIVATVCDFLLIALVITRNVTVEQLPDVDLFLILGILVVTLTLAMLWVRSRRAARVVWWLCTFFGGAWVCLGLWRWAGIGDRGTWGMAAPVVAIVAHALTAFAIQMMWPRTIEPAYGRTFE